MLPEPGEPFEERHLVAAIRYAAYIVVRYGDKYAPTFERLEKELADLHLKRSPAERARLALEAYTIDGRPASLQRARLSGAEASLKKLDAYLPA